MIDCLKNNELLLSFFVSLKKLLLLFAMINKCNGGFAHPKTIIFIPAIDN